MDKEQMNNAVRDIIGKLEEWSQSHTQKTNHDVVIQTSHQVLQEMDFWMITVFVFDSIHNDRKKLYYNNFLVNHEYTTQEKLEEFLNATMSWPENQLQKEEQ